jgi:hypothetical protein
MRATSRWLLFLKCALLAGGMLFTGLLLAGGPPDAAGPWVWNGDADDLLCLSLCELDDLFCRATVHAPMCGWHPGRVIKFTNMPAPGLVKNLSDTFWRGKHIEPDGSFINQWKKRQALSSCIRIGPSFEDGCPCIIFEYPRGTPLFGPMRDEYREIAPGLYLGRMYRRRPCVRFLGYNYLKLCTPCCDSGHLVHEEAPVHAPVPAPAPGTVPPPATVEKLPPPGRPK